MVADALAIKIKTFDAAIASFGTMA